jgi:large subunit ribosomal protein L15
VDTAALLGAGVISKARDGIRILGNGELSAKNLEIHAAGASKSAIAAVEAAGGKIVLPAVAAQD